MTVSSKIQSKWGQTANFPAGGDPWSSNPTKVDPGTDIVTPGQNAPAQHYNFALKQAEDNAISAAMLLQAASAWVSYQPNTGTLIDIRFARSAGQGWLYVVDNAGTYNAVYIDGGGPNANPGHATYRANFAGGNTPQLLWDFGNGSVVVFEANGTFRRITSGGLTSPTGVAGATWRGVGSHVYYGSANAIAVSDAGVGSLFFKSTDSGATWAAVTTPTSVNAYHSTWDVATGNGYACLVPSDGTKSKAIIWDGAALAEVTVASGIVACAYDDDNNCFYVAVWDSTDTQIYKLEHGAGWTVTNPGSVSGARVKDMVCVGGIVVINVTTAPSSWILNSDTSSLPRVIHAAARASNFNFWTPVPCNANGSVGPFLREGWQDMVAFSDVLFARSQAIGVSPAF